jgi:hypothetical protein
MQHAQLLPCLCASHGQALLMRIHGPAAWPSLHAVAAAVCNAAVSVLGGGEASGPLSPPAQLSEECFSAGEAAAAAYRAEGLGPQQIDYWGLYDCFPICFIR